MEQRTSYYFLISPTINRIIRKDDVDLGNLKENAMSMSDTGSFVNCPQCDASYDVTGFEPGKVFECQLCGGEVRVEEQHIQSPENNPPQNPGPDRSTGKQSSTETNSRNKSKSAGSKKQQASKKRKRSRSSQSRRRSRSSSNTSNMLLLFAMIGFLGIAFLFVFMGREEVNKSGSVRQKQKNQNFDSTDETDVSLSASSDEQNDSQENTSPDSTKGNENSERSSEKSERSSEKGDKKETGKSTSESQSSDTSKTEKTSSESDPDKQKNQERTDSKTASKQQSESLPDKEWSYDKSIVEKLLKSFEGASSKPLKELKKKRAELIKKHPPKKLIPAAIQALFKTDSTWKADEINKILKELTDWSKAPQSLKGPNTKIIKKGATNWKKYWMSIDWDKQQDIVKKKETITKRAKELKPLCEQVLGSFNERMDAYGKIKEKGTSYIPALIELLKPGYGKASRGAHKFLTKYTNRNPNFPEGDDRSDYIKGWKQWWNQNKNSFSY